MTSRKNYRAGYQGKRDVLRERADRLMNPPGEARNAGFSQSASPFKKGRPPQRSRAVKKGRCLTLALGGAAKVRQGVAKPRGLPLNPGHKKGKNKRHAV